MVRTLQGHIFRKRALPFILCFLIFAWPQAVAQTPDLRTGQIPTLAPIVKQTAPAVVNISVHARVKEDNPLYRDPIFREFFNLPRTDPLT